MLYALKNGKAVPVEHSASLNENADEYYISVNKLDSQNPKLQFNTVSSAMLSKIVLNSTPRFESHDKLDVICINMSNVFTNAHIVPVFIFIQEKTMQFACENTDNVSQILNKIFSDDISDNNLGRVLHSFFEYIFHNHLEHLEKIEEGITKLEDDIIINKIKDNYTQKIISLRKHLTRIKIYYEQFIEIISCIDINENNSFDKQTLKHFRILQGKVNRLYNKVLNLRDYVTQIREAYQAEVDINLNSIMKLLTVITVIFLPLSLLVGWYGMNLSMPEYGIKYYYPIVILASVIIVVFFIAYFKKNKWF